MGISLLKRALLLVLVVVLAPQNSADAQEALEPVLEPYLTKFELPALGVAVVKKGEIVAVGAVGTRRHGQAIPVTRQDRFHLGSDTKAMTALLAGQAVDAGKLRWDSTPGQVFKELSGSMDAGFRDITLTQLLSHTSGLPSEDESFFDDLGKAMQDEGNLDEIRYRLLKTWCTKELKTKSGSAFAYSNKGYMIVGAMLERVEKKTWDELITERIFGPLQLKSAGLGPQSSLGKVDAPLGHIKDKKGFKAFLAGPNGDNPTVVGPAGIAHMSVTDFAQWASWHAGGGKRGPKLVTPETLGKLHAPVISLPVREGAMPGTPKSGQYGLGWGTVNVAWSTVPLLHHGGSNQKNLAHIWVDTEHDQAIVLVTNISNAKADEALYGLAEVLAKQYAIGR